MVNSRGTTTGGGGRQRSQETRSPNKATDTTSAGEGGWGGGGEGRIPWGGGWSAWAPARHHIYTCIYTYIHIHKYASDRPTYLNTYMGDCQNYGPFFGTLNIWCRIILRIQKGTIILTTTRIRYDPPRALF